MPRAGSRRASTTGATNARMTSSRAGGASPGRVLAGLQQLQALLVQGADAAGEDRPDEVVLGVEVVVDSRQVDARASR